MSQGLYFDLMNEAEKINELLKLTDQKRKWWKIKVLREPEDVISDQCEIIKMSAIWIDQKIIDDTKKWAFIDGYKWEFEEKILRRTFRKLPQEIRWHIDEDYDDYNDNNRRWKFSIDILDILTRKPSGDIITYKIKQDICAHEFFLMMWCNNEEEVRQLWAKIAMNLEQARVLYQHRMFSESGPWEGMFVHVGDDIKYINMAYRRERGKWISFGFWNIEKDRTLFIFEPKDKIFRENI